MTTMLAARLYGPGDVRVEECPVPVPGVGELVVRVEAALTCATDLKMLRNGNHPALGPLPARIGHEMSGTVAAIGPGTSAVKEGDRVFVANSAPCGRCSACGRGQPSQCRDLVFLHGGFAHYLLVTQRVAERNVVPLHDTLSFEHAAIAEPLACALRAVEAARVSPGKTVVVTGGGALGLLLVRLARRAGARVILVGRRPERVTLGRESFGADEAVDGSRPDVVERVVVLTGKEGAEVVIEAVGTPESWGQAVGMARSGGQVIFFGGCAPETELRLDAHRLHYGELTLQGVFHHTPRHIREALALLADGAVDPRPLFSGEVGLRELQEAFKMMEARKGIKYVVRPWR